jgi:hypothetical protein
MPRIHHRPLVHLTLEVPALAVRTKLWRQVVPALDEPTAEALSGRFAIPGGIIVAAAQAAVAGRMPDAPPPGAGELGTAVATQLHQRLSRLGKKLPTPFDLDDLIVDDDTRAALVEIATAAGQRRSIRDAFKLRGAQGISVLFSGHPGVGKTMSGTVLARRLGLDISSRPVESSKWRARPRRTCPTCSTPPSPANVLCSTRPTAVRRRTTDVKSSATATPASDQPPAPAPRQFSG